MKRQRGMSLVAALFLLVVVAALGAFAVRIGAGQQHTVNLSLLSTRALSAANAGVEWGARRALMESSCAASQTLSLNEGALNGFTVRVECAPSAHADGGSTTTVYSITALAQSGTYGSPDYVRREVRARFTDAT